jgi:hypothetical protein
MIIVLPPLLFLGGGAVAVVHCLAVAAVATRDRRYYSPFSLLLGVGCLALLAGELERQ